MNGFQLIMHSSLTKVSGAAREDSYSSCPPTACLCHSKWALKSIRSNLSVVMIMPLTNPEKHFRQSLLSILGPAPCLRRGGSKLTEFSWIKKDAGADADDDIDDEWRALHRNKPKIRLCWSASKLAGWQVAALPPSPSRQALVCVLIFAIPYIAL